MWTMKAKIIIAVLFLVFAGGATGLYLFNMKVPGLEGIRADYQLEANDLFDAFDQDEASAMSQYENKVIEVSGKVVSVKNTDEGQANVILEAVNAMAGGVNCSFNHPVEDLTKGELVTIRGRCQGFLMDVVLNNCYNVKG